MPTVRYEYKFEQVQAQFQKFTQEIAVDTMNMFGTEYTGRFRFVSHGGGYIYEMEVELFSIRFYPKHVGVNTKLLGTTKIKEAIMFDVEEKVYRDTPHNTKINLLRQEDKEPVMQFLAQVMGDEKPEARFSLKQIIQSEKAKNASEYEKMLSLIPQNAPITKVFLLDQAIDLGIERADAENFLLHMLKEEKVITEPFKDCYQRTGGTP